MMTTASLFAFSSKPQILSVPSAVCFPGVPAHGILTKCGMACLQAVKKQEKSQYEVFLFLPFLLI